MRRYTPLLLLSIALAAPPLQAQGPDSAAPQPAASTTPPADSAAADSPRAGAPKADSPRAAAARVDTPRAGSRRLEATAFERRWYSAIAVYLVMLLIGFSTLFFYLAFRQVIRGDGFSVESHWGGFGGGLGGWRVSTPLVCLLAGLALLLMVTMLSSNLLRLPVASEETAKTAPADSARRAATP